jgi:hypothetical protein
MLSSDAQAAGADCTIIGAKRSRLGACDAIEQPLMIEIVEPDGGHASHGYQTRRGQLPQHSGIILLRKPEMLLFGQVGCSYGCWTWSRWKAVHAVIAEQ